MKLKDNLLNIFNKKFWGIYLVIFFIIVRLPYLGFSNFNTDSFKWKARIYDFGSGVFNLNFSQTVQKYHPGVTLLWTGTVSVKFYNFIYSKFYGGLPKADSAEFLFTLNYYQILFIILALSFLIFKSYKYLSIILGEFKALVVLCVFTLEPFFMGLTTTLHLDGLLNLFLLNFLLCFFLYLDNKGKNYFYISGIYFGLALLTKTTAVLFLPIVILFLILNFYKKRSYEHLKHFLYFCFVFTGVYFVVWPGMWVDPIGTLTYVLKGVTVGTEDHSQIYFGKLVSDPGAFYYLIVFFIKTAIYIFPGLLIAAYRQFGTTYGKYKFELYLFLTSILYLIEITIPSKKLDRYILTFSMLVSIAVISYIYDWNKKAAISLIFLNLVTAFYLNFDFFSYYNPLSGGLRPGISWVEPKWAFGQIEISDFFKNEINKENLAYFQTGENISKLSEKNDKLVVAIPEKYYTQLNPYFKLIGGWAVINEIRPEAKKAGYFIFPFWDDSSPEFIKSYNLIYYNQISVRGVPVFNVYKVNDK